MNFKKNIENYILNYLSKPNNRFYKNLQPCPFAKKAFFDNKIKIKEVQDTDLFWQTVVKECEDFTGDKDVVIVACNTSVMSIEALMAGCDSLNNLFGFQKKDLWLLASQNFANAMILIQKLSLLDDASKQLEEKGYYKFYDSNAYKKHILKRRKIREENNING